MLAGTQRNPISVGGRASPRLSVIAHSFWTNCAKVSETEVENNSGCLPSELAFGSGVNNNKELRVMNMSEYLAFRNMFMKVTS